MRLLRTGARCRQPVKLDYFRVADHTFGIRENKIKSYINERSGPSGIYR